MFGMGFTEILSIAVIAVLFIGPDKLPQTMIDIAKFFRNVKNTIGSVKETLEDELNISDIKKEALAYKAELENASSKLYQVTDVKSHINKQIGSITDSIEENDIKEKNDTKEEKKTQEVTFKKKKKNDIDKTDEEIDKEEIKNKEDIKDV